MQLPLQYCHGPSSTALISVAAALVQVRQPDAPHTQLTSVVPKLRSLRDSIRRLGVVNTGWWLLARVLAALSSGKCNLFRYYFIAQPVPGEMRAFASGNAAVAVGDITATDSLIAQFPRPQHVIARRFATGATCLAAERRGIFAGYIWIKESQYMEDEVRCLYVLEPADGVVWDFDVYVDPAFRYGRTFARLWDAANAWMRRRGYRWTISRISAFNPESLAAHRRFATRRIGTATFMCIGKLQVALLDDRPFVHIGWRDWQHPTLRFRAPRPDGMMSRLDAFPHRP